MQYAGLANTGPEAVSQSSTSMEPRKSVLKIHVENVKMKALVFAANQGKETISAANTQSGQRFCKRGENYEKVYFFDICYTACFQLLHGLLEQCSIGANQF